MVSKMGPSIWMPFSYNTPRSNLRLCAILMLLDLKKVGRDLKFHD